MVIRRPVGGIVTVEPTRERGTAAKQSVSLATICAGAWRAVGARPGGPSQTAGSRLAIQWSPRFSNFSFRTVNAALLA